MCGNWADEVKVTALSLAMYFQAITDVLIDFIFIIEREVDITRQMGDEHERRLRVLSGAKFLVDAGSEAEKKFKHNLKGNTYGFGHDTQRQLSYCVLAIFLKGVRAHEYQNQLATMREKLLSVVNPKIPLKTRRKNAKACVDFFSKMEATCLKANGDNVPRVPAGIGKLLSPPLLHSK